MATQSGRKTISLIDRLYKEPWRFSFFQAVRLIQNVFGQKTGQTAPLEAVGSDASHSRELIQFSAPPSMAYSTSDVVDISSGDAESGHDMKVGFIGMAGVSGALPSHYTEFLLQRQRAKDTAMRDFYDLFNHRAISLFFRAWKKHRLPHSYEAHKVHGKPDSVDPITNALLALVGHRVTPSDTSDSISRAERLLFFGGVYASSQRSPGTLSALLSEYFSVPVSIEQFVGEWGDLHRDDWMVLGSGDNLNGKNNQLGVNAIIGSRVYCVESRFRIVIGALNSDEFEKIKPGSKGLHALCELARGYVGPNVAFDLKMKLDFSAASSTRLKGPGAEPSNLGWNTWLISPDHLPQKGEITEVHLPSTGL
ncbi:type VI secretion system baseplate subunit TssG [Pseudomonadota bacterium]